MTASLLPQRTSEPAARKLRDVLENGRAVRYSVPMNTKATASNRQIASTHDGKKERTASHTALAVRARAIRVLSRQNSFVTSKTATKHRSGKDLEFCRQKCDLPKTRQ